MTFNEYQKAAIVTAKPWDNRDMQLAYYGLGLAGESGECVEVIKKHLRNGTEVDRDALKRELGDVLWYVNALTDYFELELDDVAKTNVAKLTARYGTAWRDHANRTGEGR